MDKADRNGIIATMAGALIVGAGTLGFLSVDYTCQTARVHEHRPEHYRTVQVDVISWDGCELITREVATGQPRTFFGTFAVPGYSFNGKRINVYHDAVCNQIGYATLPEGESLP